jgi:phage tail tape-measure protein
MNSPTSHTTGVKTADSDLGKQAIPGHGVPSQDPDPAAQVALSPEEADRESNSVLIGGGVVAGAAAGAAVGAAVAGPVGVLVGGTFGAVAGAIGGNASGQLVTSENATSVDDAPKEVEDSSRGIPSR